MAVCRVALKQTAQNHWNMEGAHVCLRQWQRVHILPLSVRMRRVHLHGWTLYVWHARTFVCMCTNVYIFYTVGYACVNMENYAERQTNDIHCSYSTAFTTTLDIFCSFMRKKRSYENASFWESLDCVKEKKKKVSLPFCSLCFKYTCVSLHMHAFILHWKHYSTLTSLALPFCSCIHIDWC